MKDKTNVCGRHTNNSHNDNGNENNIHNYIRDYVSSVVRDSMVGNNDNNISYSNIGCNNGNISCNNNNNNNNNNNSFNVVQTQINSDNTISENVFSNGNAITLNCSFSFCPNCGKKLNLSSTPKFCPFCGDQII